MNRLPETQRPRFESGSLPVAARSVIVNRTHRVVREQALALQAQKQRTRSLWVPVAICSTLLLITCYAAWALLDGYDLVANGVLDGSYQMLVFLAWSLPVTILVVGLVWMQRVRTRSNGDA